MTAKTAASLRFTLSGPGIDKSYETAGVAVSAGITYADHREDDATFYVRDFDGKVVGTITHVEGETFINVAEFIGTEQVA